MDYVLGIDGGGTKTRGILMDLDGKLIGDMVVGPSNYHTYGIELASEAISAIFEEVKTCISLESLKFVYLGLSGADVPEDFNILNAALAPIFGSVPFKVENDTWCVLQSAQSQSWGAVSIYGTGANAGAVSESGEKHILRALNYTAGGYGGGYEMAMSALHFAFRSEEETYKKTALEDEIPKLLSVKDMASVVPLVFPEHGIPYEKILKITPLLFQLALKKDAVCLEILHHFGKVQGEMVSGLIKRAKLQDKNVPVVLGGSVYKGVSSAFIDAMMQEIQKTAPKAYAVIPDLPPVAGAVLSAFNAIGHPVDYQGLCKQIVSY